MKYGIMHPELAKGVELLMVNFNSCTASFTQRAALAAVTGPQDDVDRMRDAFRERRDWLVPALNEIPGEGHFQLSFANSLENLKIAVDRIAEFTIRLH